MFKKFNIWWSIWGQLWGFIILIVLLNSFWMIFMDEMRNDARYTVTWLIMFFGGAFWYSWQSKKHGWRLPKDIRDTHGW